MLDGIETSFLPLVDVKIDGFTRFSRFTQQLPFHVLLAGKSLQNKSPAEEHITHRIAHQCL